MIRVRNLGFVLESLASTWKVTHSSQELKEMVKELENLSLSPTVLIIFNLLFRSSTRYPKQQNPHAELLFWQDYFENDSEEDDEDNKESKKPWWKFWR